MRKLAIILVSFLTILSITACGGSQTKKVSEPQPAPQEAESAAAPGNDPVNVEPRQEDEPDSSENDELQIPPVFFFKIGDVVVDMDQDIADVIDKAGEPIAVLELPSCAFEGMDRVFRYPGADLYTYPIMDDDFVYTIVFFDDSVRTAEGGIRLGSNLRDVLDAYGDDYELDSGMYTYTRGLTVLEFLVEDDIVIGIIYRLIIEQ